MNSIIRHLLCATLACTVLYVFSSTAAESRVTSRTVSIKNLLDSSQQSDWRALDPNNTLYMDLPSGRVVIELSTAYAPYHTHNIHILAREHYWDGLYIFRVQDNFVAEWGDPASKVTRPARLPITSKPPRSLGSASATLPAEFERNIDSTEPFTRLTDGDTYAEQVGFSRGFPVARDVDHGKTWLVNCYGMVGVARGNAKDSGSGATLYVVIGQAPRQLDRNVALVGRVVKGMDLLSALARGKGPLGVYENPAHRTRILRVRLASDVATGQRSHLEVLRTDTRTFAELLGLRRDPPGPWYHHDAGKVSVCNVPLPSRKMRSASRHTRKEAGR